MKVKKVVVVVMFFLTVVLFSENRPRVAILDFKATGVSSEHAEIVTEIFRSKVITSSVFDVLERKNLENIMMENSLALSGLVEKPAEIGKLLGAEYLITGSFMKMGNKLLVTVNLINAESGKIIGSSEMTIDNMDSVYDSLTVLTTDLIKSSLGLNKFTFSTETEGLSVEFAANYLTDSAGDGVGFTFGISNGRGNFWSGYSTTWNFTSIKGNNNDFGSEKKIIGCFGAGNFIFGNKVEKLALLLGIGAGYDFQGGILAIPSIGGYYKNIYLKYSQPLVIDPSGDNSIQNYNMIEIGYSYFMGSFGKGVVNFK
ncbi:MAG TPA: CsgG/HfaB family protein [Clostridiales bacterium]|nr:CsgG/HfaB family protein [Clostridiales bacterium]HQP69813.1 CsgG/HfaB family protein [Clostridiales bacterium]